jgi:dTMP kinase
MEGLSLTNHQQSLPGKLIAVEGLDGSGKSTQVSLLKRWLQLDNYKVFFTEWNSSPLVRRSTRKGKEQKLLTPTTFALIHCTDFADRYERQILPLLNAGYIVLADRYIYTAYARDGARECSPQWIKDLYSFARIPDLTFYFDVPMNVALDRILSSRPELKFHEAGMDLQLSPDPYESFQIFQGRIHAEYEKIVDEHSLVRVDATLAPHLQQENIRKIILENLNLEDFEWDVPPDLTQLLWRIAR